MSDKPNATQSPQSKEAMEEAQKKLAELKDQLNQATKAAHESIAPALKVARERHQEAEMELKTARELREQLEPHKADLVLGEHHERMRLLEVMYAQMKVYAQAEIQVWERNLAQLALVPLNGQVEDYTSPPEPELCLPVADPNYLLHRTLLDVALLAYHWHRNRAAIEVVLRAAEKETSVYQPAADHHEAFAGQVAEVKQAAAADRDLAVLTGSLASTFEETYALLDWGQSRANTLAQLPPAARKTSLDDPDWAKLNGGLTHLLDVKNRVAAHPRLAALFAEED
jgi:hypothetical protein